MAICLREDRALDRENRLIIDGAGEIVHVSYQVLFWIIDSPRREKSSEEHNTDNMRSGMFII